MLTTSSPNGVTTSSRAVGSPTNYASRTRSSYSDADVTTRRSNLIIKGVVASIKRELRAPNAAGGRGGGPNNTGNSTPVRESFDYYNGDNTNTSALSMGNGGVSGNAEDDAEHVATFVLDASSSATALAAAGDLSFLSTSAALGGAAAGINTSKASTNLGAAAASPSSPIRPPANTVTLRLYGDWALSTSFVVVGDVIEASKFDVDTMVGSRNGGSRNSNGTGTGLVVVANNCTELNVIRMKHININSTNVGQLEVLELTDREQAEARHAFSNVPPQRFGDKNSFAAVDRYYDVIKGQSSSINPQMAFLQSIFGFRTNLLDAGCGSGLYSFAFRGYGVYPVCIDASHTMQRRFEEKNRFFQQAEFHQKQGGGGAYIAPIEVYSDASTINNDRTNNHNTNTTNTTPMPSAAAHLMGSAMDPNTTRSVLMARRAQKALALRGTSELEFHLADLSSFSLAKRDVDGTARYTEFDGVLCLDVLALLPDVDTIRAALHNLSLHTGKGGLAVISLPNAIVALDKGCHMNTMAFEIDRFKLSVGAVSVPQGTLHLTETIMVDDASSGVGGGGLGNTVNAGAHSPASSGAVTGALPRSPAASTFAGGGGTSPSSYAGHATSSVRGGPQSSTLRYNNHHQQQDTGLPRRVTTWKGTAFHPTATGAANKFVSFVETFTELLLPAGLVEQLFVECGYSVRGLYGSLTGEAFVDTISDNRYYVLMRV